MTQILLKILKTIIINFCRFQNQEVLNMHLRNKLNKIRTSRLYKSEIQTLKALPFQEIIKLQAD